LKIDRSFVMNLGDEDSSDETLVAAVVAMAQALGITTVAEGVETPAQADRLIGLGCDSAQGYLYSRPVPSNHVLRVIASLDSASISMALANGDEPTTEAEMVTGHAGNLSARVELENELRHALERDQLQLAFQPVVRLPDGTVEGFEATVSWVHPRLGVLPDVQLIPLAEDCGMIVEIGRWVIAEALRSVAWWRSQPGLDHLSVGVNLSGVQLFDEALVERVRHGLATNGLPGSALTVELSESAVMNDMKTAVAVLGSLRNLGSRTVIDSFGTEELSGLLYLGQIPVDQLKMDPTFAEHLDDGGSADETLVSAVVETARALDIAVYAEGVTTPGEAARLAILGCKGAQGDLYSPSVPSAQVPAVAGSPMTSVDERVLRAVG
jgi:EAL domain-containing protein (putative c-di-GMP-specific phosphodiesterase class I)